jgi:hypothetical protein
MVIEFLDEWYRGRDERRAQWITHGHLEYEVTILLHPARVFLKPDIDEGVIEFGGTTHG